MVSPKDPPRRDPRNVMKQKHGAVNVYAVPRKSGAHMVEQPMCGGKALHRFLSKKGNKELYKQHMALLGQQGVPPLSVSETSSTTDVPNHEGIREDNNQRPVKQNQVSERQAYAYDKLPPTPTYGNPRSFENTPPERGAPQYQSHNFPYQPDHVVKDQPTQQIQQSIPSEGGSDHRNQQSRTPPIQQLDSTQVSGYQHYFQNASPTHDETPADAGRVMEALDQVAELGDDVDDSVKLETLRAMRDVVMQQQETLKAMSTQNHTYRKKLGVAQTKFHSFHQCQMNQMTMIEKLQMEKDSFESEALLLREENNIMRQELERLRKHAAQEIESRQGRQPRQSVPPTHPHPAQPHPAHHTNQPSHHTDTSNWHLQRERESNIFSEDDSPWQNYYSHTSESARAPPLPNPEAYAQQRNLQPSNPAPDPPEEMNSGASPEPEDNTRKQEYLRDMEYVQRLLSKYGIDETDAAQGRDLGEKPNSYHPQYDQTRSSKDGTPYHQNPNDSNPASGRMMHQNHSHNNGIPTSDMRMHQNHNSGHPISGRMTHQKHDNNNPTLGRRMHQNNGNSNPTSGRMMGSQGFPAEALYIDTNAKYHRKFQSPSQGGPNAEASRRQNHDKNNQNPRRSTGNVASGHPVESLYIDTAARGPYENQQKIQQPDSNHHRHDEARDTASSQRTSNLHYASKGDNDRAKRFARALNHRRGHSNDRNRNDQEDTMAWRSSSPATTIEGSARSHSETREPVSSEWEEEDSDSLSTTERKRETNLGAAPFAVQNMANFDGMAEQDRHILMAAAYHSHVQKQMHQKQKGRDNTSY